MNLRRPQTALICEAMASELNARGEPYRYGEHVFPRGEWVAVDEPTARRLKSFGWAEVREQGGAPSPV